MSEKKDHPPSSQTQKRGGSNSFSRLENSSPFSRIDSTAEGMGEAMQVVVEDPLSSPGHGLVEEPEDVFEKKAPEGSQGEGESAEPAAGQPPVELPEQFAELPIELVSLTDRFIASLSAKTFTTPPSIDTPLGFIPGLLCPKLGPYLNACFYPSVPTAPHRRRDLQRRPTSSHGTQKDTPEQQMLTAEEVAEKRKARKLLQFKQHALEEAVERRACETIYDKIWRHRSTIDDVRDEKLRSKTAALLVMGIELKDLGVDISKQEAEETVDPKECVAAARQCLIRMNDERYPLGKLQQLVAAHKAIVDALTNILPSSSSADEILPTLIYTLILSPPEGVNIISNLNFIQRFRSSSKIDGETAYCLTNLEAAIDFLENVDLTNLRMEEGRAPIDQPDLNLLHPAPMDSNSDEALEKSPTTVADATSTAPSARPTLPTNPSAQQRLSDLFQPPAKALGAANDIVRSTADQGLKSISSTLDNSFAFLFGRLKEVQISQGDNARPGTPIVPKTLDDARKLVQVKAGTVPPDEAVSEDGSNIGDRTPTPTPSISSRQPLDDRLAELVGGRRRPGMTKRDSSTNRSDTNASDDTAASSTATPPPISSSTSSTNQGFGSVRGFGTSLNPLSHFPSMIRGLARAPDSAAASSSTRAKSPGPSSGTKGAPGIQKFLDMGDASELKVGDIPELLEDYKRLAAMLKAQQNN
ncbi:VPS9 domain-containing protein [Trichophyton equinum CBS 127.97]|uniref:VPS9 domain-containing protein n=1 Tax=Trichophyton equinum (strain ATCC MYA-4606 / CBS 127.97) TaxID=559882 RepID=F2PGP9_TRIEC|nr:VPS9 domain-containing protein [Trichophyton equinum CBS 127.97]